MSAIKQALREHVAGHDVPIAALDPLVRSVFACIHSAKELAARNTDAHIAKFAADFHSAVSALWTEYEGDPASLLSLSPASGHGGPRDIAHSTRAPSALDQRVAASFRRWRVTADISRKDIADVLGVSIYSVHKWESGSVRVSAASLFEVATAFQAPLDMLFPAREGDALPAAADAVISFVRCVGNIRATELIDALATATRLIADGNIEGRQAE